MSSVYYWVHAHWGWGFISVSGRHLGFVTSLPAAILDLWRHVTSGRHLGFPVRKWTEVTWPEIQDGGRKSRDVTNPRWRPEVTSQIQDGGRNRKWSLSLKKHELSKRVWWNVQKNSSYSYWGISFKFGTGVVDITSSHIFENPTELGTLTARNVRSKSPLAQVARKKTMWPGDRRAVEWGQHSEPVTLARHFFFFFFFFFFNFCSLIFFVLFFIFFFMHFFFFFIFYFSPTTEFTLDVAKGLWLAFQSCIHPATVLEATCLLDILDIPHLEVATTQWTPSANPPYQEPGQCKTGFFLLLPTWCTHVEAGWDVENSNHYILLA